jgi:magnesium transporter
VAGLENDIDEIENQLFNEDAAVSRRIYELSREVIDMQRTIHSLGNVVRALQEGFDKYGVDLELQRHLRDVLDHVLRTVDRVDAFRALLQSALTVNSTLVGQRQNEEMRRLTETSLAQNEEVKRISAWAAILFAPTLVGTIYGMNFNHMPELHWQVGYPLAILLMLVTSLALYVIFKKRRWL